MKLEIKNKKDNPLLSRIEVSGIVSFDGATPSNEQVSRGIASQINADLSVVRMKHMHTGAGARKAEFLAFVYKSKEELDRIEPKPRKQLEKEQKKAESAKKAAEAAKSAEAPKAEAPKEEAKHEEKKEGAE